MQRLFVICLSLFVLTLAPEHIGAQPLAESTFDSGADGWATGDNASELQHVSTGGRPGGYVEAQAQDEGGIWYWVAPPSFTGDFEAAYNGALRFELTQATAETTLDSADVILEGASDTLTVTVANPPTSDWTAYRIPLRPAAGWTVQGSGQAPTTAEMKDVLASIEGVRIRGNYWEEGGAVGLDNVRLQAAQTIERWVDPAQTYLQASGASDAIAINLANVGLAPGDQIHVARLGEFNFDGSDESRTSERMVAVFSGSDVLEGENERLPDAINAGQDVSTFASEIPEDFQVNGDTVEVPQGATHLFLAADDTELGDNTDLDGDFKLRITLPNRPSGLTVEAPESSVSLSWDAASAGSVVEYNIYRTQTSIDSTRGPGAYSVDRSVVEPNYVDESVTEGETYHYRVTAVDEVGNESSFSTEVRATPGPQPSPPSNVRAGATGDSSATVRWQEVADAAKYRLYRDTEPIDTAGGPEPRTAVDSTETGVADYTDTGLIPGRTYYYRVTAVDADVNESQYSAEATARPPLSVVATPDTATVAQAGTTTVDVLANDVAGGEAIDTSAVRVGEGSSHGQATVDEEAGTIDYAHDGTANFDDAFTYIVEDEEGVSDTARVVLSVREVTLVIERDTVELGKGQVGTLGPSAALAFTSTGDTSAAGLSLTLGNQSDYSVLDDTGEEVLQAGSTRTVRVGFRPDEVEAGQTTTVTLATQTGIQETVVLTGDGIGAQVGTSAENGVATLGEPVEVTVDPQGFNSTSRRLYARPGGGAFRELEDPSQIPDSLVTGRGVDYYMVLEGEDATVILPGGTTTAAQRAPFHLPVQFERLSAPISLPAEDYRMVSVPAKTSGKQALRESYGAYDPSAWRMLRWRPADGDYRAFPDIDSLRAGMGFWLVTADGSGFALGSGRTVDASEPKPIAIEPGWNQVGTPFGFAVPWDTVRIASGDIQVDGPVAYRDENYQRGVSRLRPWEGYFVFNATDRRDTLVVPPVGPDAETLQAHTGPAALSDSRLWGTGRASSRSQASTSASAKADAPAAETAADRPYTLRVTAHSRDGASAPVWLGLRAGAEEGRDALDFARAPSIAPSVRLSTPETVGGRSVPHSGSFKPPSADGQAWTLVLTHPSADGGGHSATQSVQVQVEDEGMLPEGQERYLLDLDRERRLVAGQSLSLNPGEQRRLQVIVGTEAFARETSPGISLGDFTNELQGNAPNPFNKETTLTYVLEEKTSVTLEVYNVLGQRVRTLVQGRREAGVHAVRWGGENRYGKPVGSGVYFYRIEAGDFQETRKMVLVR